MKYDPHYWHSRMEQVSDLLSWAGYSAADGETAQERERIYREGLDAALADLNPTELLKLVDDLTTDRKEKLENAAIVSRYLEAKFPAKKWNPRNLSSSI